VRKIAEQFVPAAREAQPEGPYFMGGHCLSGVIAYETAKQFMEQGQQVALLILVEADNPTVDPKPKASPPDGFAARLRIHLARVREMKLKERFGCVFDRMILFARQITAQASKPAPETRPQANDQMDYIWDILRILGSAVDAYEAGHYPGRVVSFQCSEPDVPPDQPPQYDWSRIVTGNFEVHEVPGDHIAMMSEPNVEVLGNFMSHCLREAYDIAAAEVSVGSKNGNAQ
jgi:thioesterase domain-containing protein